MCEENMPVLLSMVRFVFVLLQQEYNCGQHVWQVLYYSFTIICVSVGIQYLITRA